MSTGSTAHESDADVDGEPKPVPSPLHRLAEAIKCCSNGKLVMKECPEPPLSERSLLHLLCKTTEMEAYLLRNVRKSQDSTLIDESAAIDLAREVEVKIEQCTFLVAVCSIAGAKQLGGYRKKIIWLATKHKARFAHRPGKAPLYYTTDGALHCTFAFPYRGHIQPFTVGLGSWTEAKKRRLYGGAAVNCSIEASTGFAIGNHVFCFHYEADEYDSDTPDPSESGATSLDHDSMLVQHRVEAYESVTAVGQAVPLIDKAAIRTTSGWQLLEQCDENYLAMTPTLKALFDWCGDSESSEQPARVMMCESDQDPRAPGLLPPGCDATPAGPLARRAEVTAYWSTLVKAWGDAAVAAEEPAKPPDSDVGTQWGDNFLAVSDRRPTGATSTIMHKVDVSMWFRDIVEFRVASRTMDPAVCLFVPQIFLIRTCVRTAPASISILPAREAFVNAA